jgi:hypothetical protein
MHWSEALGGKSCVDGLASCAAQLLGSFTIEGLSSDFDLHSADVYNMLTTNVAAAVALRAADLHVLILADRSNTINFDTSGHPLVSNPQGTTDLCYIHANSSCNSVQQMNSGQLGTLLHLSQANPPCLRSTAIVSRHPLLFQATQTGRNNDTGDGQVHGNLQFLNLTLQHYCNATHTAYFYARCNQLCTVTGCSACPSPSS